MIIRRVVVGPLQTNCYIVGCRETREALIVDPVFFDEDEGEMILREVNEHDLIVEQVVNTHWHPDHTAGDEFLKRNTGAIIMIHEGDAPMLGREDIDFLGLPFKSLTPGRTLVEGDVIRVGRLSLKVMHTPGHTVGSISLLSNEILFSGDAILADSISRTDLPGGSLDDILKSLRRLSTLPKGTRIYAGHGPALTIGVEEKTNPFLCDT